MSFIPYINFRGDCENALKFYAKTFETDPPELFYFKDAPQEGMPPVDGAWIMHGAVKKGGFTLAACDTPEAFYNTPQGISVVYSVETFEDGQVVFDKLIEGGQITMPYEKTFFAEGFGMVRDKFGIHWMIAVGDM